MSTRRLKKMAVRAGLAACLVVPLAACGGEGTANGADDSVTTYTIPSLLDFSGPFANRGEPVQGMQSLIIDWFNENEGKQLGIKLELKPYDTGYDVAKSLEAYEQAKNEVDNVLGTLQFGSPIVAATVARSAQDKIPGIQGGPHTDAIQEGSWVMAPLGNYGSYFAAAVQSYIDDSASDSTAKVSFVSFDGISAQGWSKVMKEKLEGVAAEVVNEEYISPTATDVTVNVSRVLAADPDVVVLATTDQLQPLVLNALHRRGFDMSRVYMSQHEGLGLMKNLDVEDEVLEGVHEVTTQTYQDESSEAYKIYQEYKSDYKTRWAADTLLHFPSTMILVTAIGRAVEANGADGLTGEQVYEEMTNGTFPGYGLMSDITFTNSLGSPSDVYVLQMNEGSIEKVDELPLP